jgi:hypothetical protein
MRATDVCGAVLAASKKARQPFTVDGPQQNAAENNQRRTRVNPRRSDLHQ